MVGWGIIRFGWRIFRLSYGIIVGWGITLHGWRIIRFGYGIILGWGIIRFGYGIIRFGYGIICWPIWTNIDTHFHPCLPWATASGKPPPDAQGEFERYPALLATELSVVAAGGMYTFSLALPAHTAHQRVYIYIYICIHIINHISSYIIMYHVSSYTIIYHCISTRFGQTYSGNAV